MEVTIKLPEWYVMKLAEKSEGKELLEFAEESIIEDLKYLEEIKTGQ